MLIKSFNHVLWVKSIAANENQLQLFIQQVFFYRLQLIFPIHFHCLIFTLLKAHDSLQVNWIVKYFWIFIGQFSNSPQVPKTLLWFAHDLALSISIYYFQKILKSRYCYGVSIFTMFALEFLIVFPLKNLIISNFSLF